MDSLRFNQATASNGGSNDKKNAGNMVDLNLKLGLAIHDGFNHQIKLSDLFNNPVPVMTPSLANFNFNGPNTGDEKINHGPTNGAGEHVGVNHFGTICNEDSMMVGGPPFHGLGNGRTPLPFTQKKGNQSHAMNLNNNVMNRAAADQNTSPTLGVGGYFNTNLLPPATLNNYTLLDFSSKDAEIGKSSWTHRRYLRRRRKICYFDPHKTCLNPFCGTNNTPMWRRGPLGPTTLCNACGIRYRKEKVRRRAREEAGKGKEG